MYLGIELGGTKVLVSAGTNPADLTAPIRIETRDPDATCADIVGAAQALQTTHGPIQGIGIGSFGPIGVTASLADYGVMLKTPKPGWTGFPLLSRLREGVPDVLMTLDTDVNAAALGEARWGGAKGLDTFAYVTVGTGIGVGIVSGSKPVHGLLHPEAGHIRVPHDLNHDPFKGCCPFHGDCLEGLASGPSIAGRYGAPGETVADDDPVWGLIGAYLAQLYCNLTLIASPQRILVGGGVGLKPQVLAASRDTLHHLLGGYVQVLADRDVLDSYVAAAGLGDRAGILGAIALAARA